MKEDCITQLWLNQWNLVYMALNAHLCSRRAFLCKKPQNPGISLPLNHHHLHLHDNDDCHHCHHNHNHHRHPLSIFKAASPGFSLCCRPSIYTFSPPLNLQLEPSTLFSSHLQEANHNHLNYLPTNQNFSTILQPI